MASYPFPWDLFFSLSSDLPGGSRSLMADAREMVRRMSPPPTVEGEDHIPATGPLLIAANHYQRHGLWIAWPGAVITFAVGNRRGTDPPLHWMSTGGIRLSQSRDRGPELPLTRQVFRRVADIYGMAALPVRGKRSRAQALLRWLRWLDDGEVIGVFPEGLRGQSASLQAPEPGFDALLRLAVRAGARLLPVGVTERDDTLIVRFGQSLENPEDGAAVMRAIADLVPPRQRGAYADGVAR